MKLRHLLVPLLLAGVTMGALAQWQWVDQDGRKVFSDRPPPADIPERNIVRRPHVIQESEISGIPPASAGASAAGGADSNAVQKAPTSGKAVTPVTPKGQDPALEARKKAAEEQAAAQKAAEAERQAQARRENCQRARQAQNTLDSGIRIAQVNAQGERIIMDDAARAAETQRNQAVLRADCN